MNRFLEPSKHSFYLSIFRIYISLHLLYKFYSMFVFNEVLFGKDSFATIVVDATLNNIIPVDVLRNNIVILLFAGILLSLCMMVGIGKNLTIFFLFLIVDIIQRLNSFILNGGDNLLKFLLLYLIIADSFQFFTFIKYPKKESPTKNLLTNLATFSIKFHLMLIYLLSGLHKANAKVWFSGVATYYTFALERFQGTSFNKYIIQNGFFVTISTYVTLFWELFFPFLVSNKKTKVITLIIGIFLHLGIFIFMMIYDFEILFIACYGFFFTDTEIFQFSKKIRTKWNAFIVRFKTKKIAPYEKRTIPNNL